MRRELPVSIGEVVAIKLGLVIILGPLVFGAIKGLKHDRGKPQENADQEKRIEGVLGLAVLIGQGFIYNRQANIMNGQLAAAVTAAESAKRSADAAIGVEIARLHLMEVRFDHIQYPNVLRTGDISVVLKNHGRTPAYIVENAVVSFVGAALPPKPRYPLNTVGKAAMGSVVESGSYYIVGGGIRIAVPEDRLPNVFASDAIMWLYGYVVYRDFLGDRWRTRFCVSLEPGGIGRIPRFVENTDNFNYTGTEREPPSQTYSPGRPR